MDMTSIKNKDDCKRALIAIGINSTVRPHTGPYPKGCYTRITNRESYFYFNSHSFGYKEKFSAPICKRIGK